MKEETDKITIKYKSSNNEITEREISSVSSGVGNANKTITAFCHLRNEIRSFILDSIIELKINGDIVDKEKFWKQNIKDKKEFTKGLQKTLMKKKKEYENYANFVDALVKIALED